tara:strand:+ start:22 stop:831 length:810 start_codon:yes stop_codon:yes gene_type:complete
MAQPIVKYTLTKQGRIPEWLSSDSRAFAGQHSISGNKDGYIPRYESPQSRIMLGIAAGDPDPDGTPDDYIGKIASKSDLQAYLIGIGTVLGYKTTTLTLTGIQTAVTTGLATAWNANPYAGGLTTTTSAKRTMVGVGTTAILSSSLATKIVTNVITDSGSTFSTVTNAISVDPASTSTITGYSTNAVTTTSGGPEPSGITTSIVTTTTTAYNYTDITTSSATSKSETTTDGVTTRTDTVVTSENTNFETSYDYAAEATRLWDIYTAINS